MRVPSTYNGPKQYLGNIKSKVTKVRVVNVNFDKTKYMLDKMSKIEKKAGFWGVPIKYYLLTFAIPIPFISSLAFICGIGVSLYKKIKSINNKNSS